MSIKHYAASSRLRLQHPILQQIKDFMRNVSKDTAQTFSVVASDEAHTGASLEAASILDGMWAFSSYPDRHFSRTRA